MPLRAGRLDGKLRAARVTVKAENQTNDEQLTPFSTFTVLVMVLFETVR
jgi:hypothetical protein